jgi:small-conductance mechanosensitive channel
VPTKISRNQFATSHTNTTVLLSFSFIFSNAIKNVFESFIFITVARPFDCGDRVQLGSVTAP